MLLALIWAWLAGGGLLGLLLAISTYHHDAPHPPTLQARIAHACLTAWILTGGLSMLIWGLR